MRLPRVRIGVRALLLAVALLALVLARWVVSARAQARAVAAVRAAGGLVFYDYEFNGPYDFPAEGRRSPYPDWLRRALGDDFLHDAATLILAYEHRDADPRDFAPIRALTRLRALHLELDSLDRPTARWIGSLARLEHLRLEIREGSDGAAEVRLGRLTALRSLSLQGGGPASALQGLDAAGSLQRLVINDRRADDAWMPPVGRLRGLEELHLGDTRVGDAGLAHLAGLTRLRKLNLEATRVTDAGLPHLRPLRRLELLGLSWTRVGDEGLIGLLPSLPKLKGLYLAGTPVSDAAVPALRGLPRLSLLHCPEAMTDAGLARLPAGVRVALKPFRGP